MIGRIVSHYRILEKIGQGGAGVVYKAEDVKLGRTVALKFLSPDAFENFALRARFLREAQAAASLDHPNIAHVYEIGDLDGRAFLALAYVEGQSAADRIKAGPLPIGEALDIALQTAEGLRAAHEKGIVHRDIKPANVLAGSDGTVRITDFGMARLTEHPRLTQPGAQVGTPSYMPPEQIQGQDADGRADVWSLGVMLFEMLTGELPFAGDTAAGVYYAVINEPPRKVRALRPDLPREIERIVERALEKEPANRYAHMADMAADLRRAAAAVERPPAAAALRWQPALAGFAAGVILCVGLWLALRPSSAPPPPRLVTRAELPLPPGVTVALETWRPAVAISPDGSHAAIVGREGGIQRLYLRPLDAGEARPIAGTEGAYGPFFSPDGGELGFFSGWELRRIPLRGGSPQRVSAVPPVSRGADWAPGGRFLFTTNPNGGLTYLPQDGGALPGVLQPLGSAPRYDPRYALITAPKPDEGEFSHRWARFLPGGGAVLFTVDTGGNFDESRIDVLRFSDGMRKTLVEGGTNPSYAGGYLVFGRAGGLYAAQFDLAALEVRGAPARVLDGVMSEPSGAAHYALSPDGKLVYLPGRPWRPQRRLVWVSRNGAAEPLALPVRDYMQPRLSPDGGRLAVTIRDGSNFDIWTGDLARGNLTRVTFDPGEDFNPVWSADGARLFINSEIAGPGPDLAVVSAAGEDKPGPLLPRMERLVRNPESVSRRGDVLAFQRTLPGFPSGTDIWILPLDESKDAYAFLETEFDERSSAFSPDGRWLAYCSDETGAMEVYLRAFPGPGGKHQISNAGGCEPAWAPDGRELFYRDGDRMMAVRLSFDGGVRASRPELLFEKHFLLSHRPDMTREYDVAPGGRFLMVEQEALPALGAVTVVLDWIEDLRRLTASSGSTTSHEAKRARTGPHTDRVAGDRAEATRPRWLRSHRGDSRGGDHRRRAGRQSKRTIPRTDGRPWR